ncbi:Heme A synthase [Candidatus Bealeia paramacronuclearis]|uniref:Heme A synthase n=1 Tax=Candidatus Bealeia paramacronuclearis TaxID=1921001 RepID=A0ABZ2C2K9_9PROT|nr:Heme A synthase [Candidatus Bealeia paramacronuclearis]
MFKTFLWLLVVMIFGMILLGGFTRLTGSGLSIVEWQPLMGALPPLNEADWLSLFQKYQTSPEYQKVNLGMTLEEFQGIFWLEFIHRLWGRAIGVVLLIPIIMSFIKHELRSYRVPLIVLSLLVAGQGLMGWYMVASGLIDSPHVSPYRLTAHLLLGVLILGLAFLIAMKKTWPREVYMGYSRKSLRKLSIVAFISFGCVLLTIFYGGLVAGHKAGLIYNTYPLMGGDFFPSDLFFISPEWKNTLANPTTVQFIHRWMGTLTVTLIFGLTLGFWNADLPHTIKNILRALIGMAAIQFALGLFTLLLVVPQDLALTHQAGALILFILNLALLQKTLPIWWR